MRLLTIRNHPERYGAEGHVLRVAAGLAKMGWDVHAAFPETKGTAAMVDECQSRSIIYVPLRVPSNDGSRRGSISLAVYRETIRLIRKVKPDVVQVTLGWQNEALRFAAACALCNVPTLVVFQLAPDVIDFDPATRLLCRMARSRRQEWVAVSHQNRGAIARSFAMPLESLRLLFNGIETHTPFSDLTASEIAGIRADLRRELGVPDNTRLLLTTGRLTKQKGFHELAAVSGRIAQEFPRTLFLWAGTGEDRELLEAKLRETGASDAVRFLGYRTDVHRLLIASDLFIFPSRFEGGCSSSIREAMVHHLPIVTTNAGGIPEVLEHNRHALLAPPLDSEALLAALRVALGDPKHMQDMADAARERIQDFSAEKVVEDYRLAFEELVRRGR